MSRVRLCVSCTFTVAWLFFVGVAIAADDLAALVPADVGVCLTVRDLAPAGDKLLAGPLGVRVTSLQPVEKWRNQNLPALERIAEQIGEQIGVNVDDVWRGVFGRQAVLAIWPPEVAGENGSGLLLVEARDEQLLTRLIRGVLDAQLRGGEVEESEQLVHAGVSYERRRLKKGGARSVMCVASLGKLGILASDENLLHRVMDLNAAPADRRHSLQNLPSWKQAEKRLSSATVVSLFVNPRPWDRLIESELSRKRPAAERRWQLEAWRTTRYAFAGLELAPDVAVTAHLHFEQLPQGNPLAEALASLGGEAEYVRRSPHDALLVVAGRIDAGRWLKMAVGSAKEADQPLVDGTSQSPSKAERDGRMLLAGWQFVDAMCGGLGPNWGLSVRPNATAETPDIPIEAAVGVEALRRAEDADLAARSDGLSDAIRALLSLQLPKAKPESDQAARELTIEDQSGMKVVRLKNWNPLQAPLVAAFACRDRWLTAGLPSAAAVRNVSPASERNLANEPRFAAMMEQTCPRPSQLIYLDLAAARSQLAEHAEAAAGIVSKANGLTKEQAERGVRQLVGLLGVADRLLVAARF